MREALSSSAVWRAFLRRRALVAAVLPFCTACGNNKPAADAPAGVTGTPDVRWIGRVDLTEPTAPRFAWSGSGFVARVSGPSIAVKLATEASAQPTFFQPVIDGAPGPRFSVGAEPMSVRLGDHLAAGAHLVELYRETEGSFGNSRFDGFTSGTLEPPPSARSRSLEIVGDSISAGYGNLGSEVHPGYGPDPSGGCQFSTETESAYLTYGALAARALGADVSIVALSGWGAYRSNGNSKLETLGNVYENALGVSSKPKWAFDTKPDAVVVNLGTNDFATGDPGEAEFKGAYTALLATIRGKYPDAWIFCMLGPLLGGTDLTQATTYLTGVVGERNAAGDAKVKLLSFSPQDISLGTGCSYHPNATVHQQMADRVASELKSALGW
jgi:lysophospholipase L1-like esterase